jgi:hypothetical protein
MQSILDVPGPPDDAPNYKQWQAVTSVPRRPVPFRFCKRDETLNTAIERLRGLRVAV